MLSHHHEIVPEQNSLDIIHSANGLVKTICSPLGDDRSWDLLWPAFLTNGQTEPTSSTLLPTDGKMHLFKPGNPAYQVTVNLLFDLRDCQMQYIFENETYSNMWLNNPGSEVPAQITLEELKKRNAQAMQDKIVLPYNHIIAELSKTGLKGIFATKNTLIDRLNALAKQNLIATKLNKHVAILIITANEGIMSYSKNQQIQDIWLALTKEPNDPLRILIETQVNKNLINKAKKLGVMSIKTINQDSSIDTPFPNFLADLTLEYSTFSDMVRYTYHVGKTGADKVLENLIATHFEEKRVADLTSILQEISAALTTEFFYNLIDLTFFYEDTVKEQRRRYLQIEFGQRMIAHLSLLDPEGMKKLFDRYIHSWVVPDMKVIMNFINYCPNLTISKSRKRVVYIEGLHEAWESTPDISIDMYHSSPLLEVLLEDNAFSHLILHHYPQHIALVMTGLHELDGIIKKYFAACVYTSTQVNSAKLALLLNMTEQQNNHYTLTYADKRLVENHLAAKVKQLQTQAAIEDFYQLYANSPCLKQCRYPFFKSDKMHAQPRAKRQVLSALQQQLNLVPPVQATQGEEDEILKTAKAQLKTLLETKLTDLAIPPRGLQLFYSTHRTQAKQAFLRSALAEVNNLTSLVSLELFTEKLIANPTLVQRRSVGFAASNTFRQLSDFFNAQFPHASPKPA